MPKHFFPSHVVEAVAEALWKHTLDWLHVQGD